MGIFDKFKKDKDEEKEEFDLSELEKPSYMRDSADPSTEFNRETQKEARIPSRKVAKENEPSVDFPFLNEGGESQSPPPQSERTYGQESKQSQTRERSFDSNRDIDLILSKLDNIDQRLRFIEDRLKRRGTI